MLTNTKPILATKSIIGLFILVYGTTILFRLFFGKYLMEHGLLDINYLLLFLFCAIPIVIGILINKESALKFIVMISLYFVPLFILVHGSLIFSVLELTPAIVIRILTVIPISALIIVAVSYFLLNRKK